MEFSCSPLRLELRDTFRISRESSDRRNNVLIHLVDTAGVAGIGESAPSPYYGQSAESVTQALSAVTLGHIDDPFQLESIHGRLLAQLTNHRSALAALDIALHDLIGKRLGLPLYRWFGLDPNVCPVTSFTIGLASLDEMRRKTEAADGYRVLKVKLGGSNDREIVSAIREISDVPLRVDANAAWTVDEALENLRWLADEGVELVEQPLAKDDLNGYRRLTDASPLPIFADESVEFPVDVVRLQGCVHGINIKLNKCGGLREALKMIHIARAQDMQIMLGCFIESTIGISAAVHLSPLVDYADLDGHLLINNDPFEGLRLENGKVIPSDRPGLGNY